MNDKLEKGFALDGAGFEKAVKSIMQNDRAGKMPVILTYAAFYFMKEALKDKGIEIKNLIATPTDGSKAAADYKTVLNAILHELKMESQMEVGPKEKQLLYKHEANNCILVELPDWEHDAADYTDDDLARLRALGKELLLSAKGITAEEKVAVYMGMIQSLLKRHPLPHAERIAPLSCGIWLISITANRLGTRFYKCFSTDQDDVEDWVTEEITLPKLKRRETDHDE